MELPPVPRHLLERAYAQGGAGAVGNNPVLTVEWVGLGPYKMTGRTLGSQIDAVDAVAFDDYILGKPRIERLVIKATNDANALVARLLSGDVDMVPNNLEAVQGRTLKDQWEAQGRGTVVPNPTRIRQIQLNYRDPNAPWASDLRVRQAMLHLLDRQGLADSVLAGISPVGHTALLPTDPAYAKLEQLGLPKFPLDRPTAERLLDEAGWRRGSDGIRRNAAGTIFRYNQANVGESDQDETLVLVDGFKAGGIQSEPHVIAETATNQAELRAKSDGVARPAIADTTYWDRFFTAETAAESNRWRGVNTGGYSNPDFDRQIAEWRTILDANQLADRTAQMHKFLLDQLINLPLYYQVEIYAYRKGLNGPGAFTPGGRNALVEIHKFTLD
jgi:peptide/nickel transport system substrate-binding protein